MTSVVDSVNDAGGPSARAETAALDGDLDAALVLADQAILNGDARGAQVAAAVLAQRGMVADSVALYRWAQSVDGSRSGFAVAAMIAVGDLEPAVTALAEFDADPRRAPTSLATVESLIAHGVHESVTGSPVAALSQLVQAAAVFEPHVGSVLLPDTPSALACLVATQLGQFDIAESIVEGGPNRHSLLRAWISLQRGDLTPVELPACATPRDELFAAAIEIGIARRLSDHAAMLAAWPRARDAVIAHPVDLFVLQPLGEIAVAAARLREDEWLAPKLEEADNLLARLGRPALWSAPLHWYGTQVAIVAESRTLASRHAGALTSMARSSRFAGALAGCARTWLRVLSGDVQVDTVVATARELRAVGLGWDGSRLAGQAAIRTSDRQAMTTLLTCARDLYGTPVTESATPQLSAREVEVAELLVAGLTYRQIGERLFISAKTVEHHVARIRNRIGAGSTSRRDLIARLHQILTG